MKLRPLNVFSWKFLNSCRNTAKLKSIQAPLYLAPSFDRVVGLGQELEVGTGCEDAGAAGLGSARKPSRCPIAAEAVWPRRPEQGRAVEVEAARLIAARIARIGQQPVGRLVAQYRRAGELVLLKLVARFQASARNAREDARQLLKRCNGRGGERCCRIAMLSARSASGLLLMRVARAEGQLQAIGDRDDVVREQGPVVPGLVVEVVEPVPPVKAAGARASVATFVKPLLVNGGLAKFDHTERRSEVDRKPCERGQRRRVRADRSGSSAAAMPG